MEDRLSQNELNARANAEATSEYRRFEAVAKREGAIDPMDIFRAHQEAILSNKVGLTDLVRSVRRNSPQLFHDSQTISDRMNSHIRSKAWGG